MKQTLKDYSVNVKNVPLFCDNESAIKIAHNPVQHSKTKHIQIRHHFLRDHVLKGDISIEHVKTEEPTHDREENDDESECPLSSSAELGCEQS